MYCVLEGFLGDTEVVLQVLFGVIACINLSEVHNSVVHTIIAGNNGKALCCGWLLKW
jgi:hypothetical protein